MSNVTSKATIRPLVCMLPLVGGGKCTTAHLQQSRFTATVTPDNVDGFAFFDLKRDVFKRPKVSMVSRELKWGLAKNLRNGGTTRHSFGMANCLSRSRGLS